MKYFFKCVFIIIFIQINISAQYEIEIVNQNYAADSFQFDIFVKSSSAEFYLGSYQCIFNFNNQLLSYGPLEFKYIEGSSQLENKPVVSTGLQADDDIMKLCFAGSVGEDLITNEYKRIGTFGLYGAIPEDSVNLSWSFDGNIRTILADVEYNDITTPSTHLYDYENPLPVELVSFNAEAANDNVLLRWETATELNSNRFEIERKHSDDKTFSVVGRVKAKGGSTASKYSFNDNNFLLPGKYTYRLKQIDNDGRFEYLKSIEVDITKPLAYKLYQNYPNPFNPTTAIKYSLKSTSRTELNIYDMTGKLVDKIVDNIQESGVYSMEWIADNYASGIYICQLRTISIESGETFSSTSKMILLK